MNTHFNAIICRYHEIAIKGNNRGMFERKMMENIEYLLAAIPGIRARRVRGRIWIEHREKLPFSDDEMNIISRQLKKAFGLESYSPVIMTEPDINQLKAMVRASAPGHFNADSTGKTTFRVRASRSDKQFPLTSKEIEIELAEVIGDMFDHDRLEVNLNHAAVTVGCEIRDRFAFIFYDTFRCPGGLPVGSNSPVLALLSGGIDSPVACYMMMKRGCPVDYISFHSAPYTPPETVEKVKTIAAYLNGFQRAGRLYSCNIASIQKMIRDNCREDMRTILYRRMMLRIAEKIALQHGNMALLTGDSVGQVASQTVINMNTIDNAASMLVLRPLVGNDKNETVRTAREIGTMELSSVQVPDSCTVFSPRSPATAAPLPRVLEEEQKLGDWQSVLDQIIETATFCRP